MYSPLSAFLARTKTEDSLLHTGRLGLLCNQISYDFIGKQYLFRALAKRGNLKRVFIPEHGLFAELQDQAPLLDGEIYGHPGEEIEYVSLYGNQEDSLSIRPEKHQDLDALVVDIQDVGARYYTFATTLAYIFDELARAKSTITVYVIDRPNPAGRFVEGTPLPTDKESFVGRKGLPHRHGLSMGELCNFYRSQSGGNFNLKVIPLSEPPGLYPEFAEMPIAPSPNMPSVNTALVYSGQCLLEGTNISEGRGTTLPFEFFGAPWIDALDFASMQAGQAAPAQSGAILRPLRYIPTFHKYAREVCEGWQIHPTGEGYHSLAHSLKLIRYIRESRPENFKYRRGIYEFRSDRPAIEILAGDDTLLGYLNGQESGVRLREYLAENENAWVEQARDYLLYERPPQTIPLNPTEDYA